MKKYFKDMLTQLAFLAQYKLFLLLSVICKLFKVP
jgi:hypothetical protein